MVIKFNYAGANYEARPAKSQEVLASKIIALAAGGAWIDSELLIDKIGARPEFFTKNMFSVYEVFLIFGISVESLND